MVGTFQVLTDLTVMRAKDYQSWSFTSERQHDGLFVVTARKGVVEITVSSLFGLSDAEDTIFHMLIRLGE